METEIKKTVEEILDDNNAIMLATTGGEYSPWVLGAYYTRDGFRLYMMLEEAGKSIANIRKDNSVAFCISKNDATKDFLQGKGRVVILPQQDEEEVRTKLTKKMPWYQTFVPMVPIRIEVEKFFVTSLKRGWFPAKTLTANQ